jgi:hypothetical protein
VELGERGEGKKNDKVSVILQTIRCKCKGNEDVY